MNILGLIVMAVLLAGAGYLAIKIATDLHSKRTKREHRSAGAKAGWAKRRARAPAPDDVQ